MVGYQIAPSSNGSSGIEASRKTWGGARYSKPFSARLEADHSSNVKVTSIMCWAPPPAPRLQLALPIAQLFLFPRSGPLQHPPNNNEINVLTGYTKQRALVTSSSKLSVRLITQGIRHLTNHAADQTRRNQNYRSETTIGTMPPQVHIYLPYNRHTHTPHNAL